MIPLEEGVVCVIVSNAHNTGRMCTVRRCLGELKCGDRLDYGGKVWNIVANGTYWWCVAASTFHALVRPDGSTIELKLAPVMQQCLRPIAPPPGEKADTYTAPRSTPVARVWQRIKETLT